jgi:hypothetical protein
MMSSVLPNASFDCVVAVEVIEHVVDDADVHYEIRAGRPLAGDPLAALVWLRGT